MNYDEQKLKVNYASHRLELEIERNIAFIEYKLSGETLPVDQYANTNGKSQTLVAIV